MVNNQIIIFSSKQPDQHSITMVETDI